MSEISSNFLIIKQPDRATARKPLIELFVISFKFSAAGMDRQELPDNILNIRN